MIDGHVSAALPQMLGDGFRDIILVGHGIFFLWLTSSDQTRAVTKRDSQKRASPLVVCIALVGRFVSFFKIKKEVENGRVAVQDDSMEPNLRPARYLNKESRVRLAEHLAFRNPPNPRLAGNGSVGP